MCVKNEICFPELIFVFWRKSVFSYSISSTSDFLSFLIFAFSIQNSFFTWDWWSYNSLFTMFLKSHIFSLIHSNLTCGGCFEITFYITNRLVWSICKSVHWFKSYSALKQFCMGNFGRQMGPSAFPVSYCLFCSSLFQKKRKKA